MFREVEEDLAPSPKGSAAEVDPRGPLSASPGAATRARFVVVDKAFKPPHVPPPKDKPNPKLGIGALTLPREVLGKGR